MGKALYIMTAKHDYWMKTFDGSLPRFVAAFLNSKPISAAEAAEIRALLDAAQSKEG